MLLEIGDNVVWLHASFPFFAQTSTHAPFRVERLLIIILQNIEVLQDVMQLRIGTIEKSLT